MSTGVTVAGRVEPPMASREDHDRARGRDRHREHVRGGEGVLVHGETDASGAFTLKNVPAGAFKLTAGAPTATPASRPSSSATPISNGLVVKLEPRASVSGRVSIRAASRSPACTVNVGPARRRRQEDEVLVQRQRNATARRPAADGTFKLVGLEAGKYRVRAIGDGSGEFEFTEDKKDERAKAEVELELAASDDEDRRHAHGRGARRRDPRRRDRPRRQAGGRRVGHRARVCEKTEGMPERDSRPGCWGRLAPRCSPRDGQFTISKLRKGTYNLIVDGPEARATPRRTA